jgi:hypothetical protein
VNSVRVRAFDWYARAWLVVLPHGLLNVRERAPACAQRIVCRPGPGAGRCVAAQGLLERQPEADAIHARIDLLETVNSAKALAMLNVGDRVRFTHHNRPQYLRVSGA